jgi:hypothetical protein
MAVRCPTGDAGLTTKYSEIEAKSFVIKDLTIKSLRFKDRPGNFLLTPVIPRDRG